MRFVPGEGCDRVEPPPPRAGKRLSVGEGARGRRRPVAAVGARREDRNPAVAREDLGCSEGELETSSAASRPA